MSFKVNVRTSMAPRTHIFAMQPRASRHVFSPNFSFSISVFADRVPFPDATPKYLCTEREERRVSVCERQRSSRRRRIRSRGSQHSTLTHIHISGGLCHIELVLLCFQVHAGNHDRRAEWPYVPVLGVQVHELRHALRERLQHTIQKRTHMHTHAHSHSTCTQTPTPVEQTHAAATHPRGNRLAEALSVAAALRPRTVDKGTAVAGAARDRLHHSNHSQRRQQ
jgi:hypothetical protein